MLRPVDSQAQPLRPLRESLRLPVEIAAQYRLLPAKDFVECSIRNLSSDGAFFYAKAPFLEGDKVQLAFKVGKVDICVNVLVNYVLGKGVGVVFLDISQADKKAIAQLLHNNFMRYAKDVLGAYS